MTEVADGGRRIKIAIVVPRLTGGGAEFVACEWARQLTDGGHLVTLITTHDRDKSASDLHAFSLTATSFWSRIGQLRRHIAESQYDVLLGMMPHWNLLVLLSTIGRGKRPPATLISGHNVEVPLRRIFGRTRRIEQLLCRVLYRRADGFVAVSHPVAAEAAETYKLDPERVWVVPNPAAGKNPRHSSNRGHGPAHAETVTLTVPARLVAQKRPQLAVETAVELATHYEITASVDFFGLGSLETEVQEVAERLAVRVRFRGWRTAWFDEAAADAVVMLPSAAEGFGNVLVEAAAAGIPSVASSRALGVADAIVPNVTGVLAIGSEPRHFANAVIEAMRLTPVRAPEWVQRFSPEESARQLLEVMRSVTDQSSLR